MAFIFCVLSTVIFCLYFLLFVLPLVVNEGVERVTEAVAGLRRVLEKLTRDLADHSRCSLVAVSMYDSVSARDFTLIVTDTMTCSFVSQAYLYLTRKTAYNYVLLF